MSLNPGLANVFPWLSTIAQNYESYRFKKLRAYFVSVCATSTVGEVILTPEYDVNDSPPTTEQAVSNTAGSVAGPVWMSHSLLFNTNSLNSLGPRKFVRGGNVAGDLKTYDSGLLYVSVVNGAVTANIGKIWLEYEVEFFDPQTQAQTPVAPASTSVFKAVTGFSQSCIGSNILVQCNQLTYADPLRVAGTTNTVFSPPKGSYIVTAQIVVYDVYNEDFAVNFSFTINNVLTGTPAVYNGNPYATPGPGTQVQTLFLQTLIQINQPTDYVQLLVTGTTQTYSSLNITDLTVMWTLA